MPIPVINYSSQTPNGFNIDPLGSLYAGINLGLLPFEKNEQLNAARLGNSLLSLKNKYAPQQFESELEQGRLANELANINLEYAPQMNESLLENRRIGNALADFELQNAPESYGIDRRHKNLANDLAELNLQFLPQEKGAEIAYRRAMADQLPVKLAMEQERLKYLSNRFGSVHKFSNLLKNIPSANKAAYVAENAPGIAKMLTDLGNEADSEIAMFGNANQDLPYELALNLTPEQEGNLVKSGIARLKNIVENGGQEAPIPTPRLPSVSNPKNTFATNPELEDRIKLGAQLSANNALATNYTRRQMEGALQIESFLDDPEFNRVMESASEYAGSARRGYGHLQKFLQMNPRGQLDYESFKNQYLTALTARIKQVEGMGSTDAQRKELHAMQSIADDFYSNPARFRAQIKNLKKLMNVVARSVEESYNVMGYENRVKPLREVVRPSKKHERKRNLSYRQSSSNELTYNKSMGGFKQ